MDQIAKQSHSHALKPCRVRSLGLVFACPGKNLPCVESRPKRGCLVCMRSPFFSHVFSFSRICRRAATRVSAMQIFRNASGSRQMKRASEPPATGSGMPRGLSKVELRKPAFPAPRSEAYRDVHEAARPCQPYITVGGKGALACMRVLIPRPGWQTSTLNVRTRAPLQLHHPNARRGGMGRTAAAGRPLAEHHRPTSPASSSGRYSRRLQPRIRGPRAERRSGAL
jgi:hypothetical protein